MWGRGINDQYQETIQQPEHVINFRSASSWTGGEIAVVPSLERKNLEFWPLKSSAVVQETAQRGKTAWKSQLSWSALTFPSFSAGPWPLGPDLWLLHRGSDGISGLGWGGRFEQRVMMRPLFSHLISSVQRNNDSGCESGSFCSTLPQTSSSTPPLFSYNHLSASLLLFLLKMCNQCHTSHALITCRVYPAVWLEACQRWPRPPGSACSTAHAEHAEGGGDYVLTKRSLTTHGCRKTLQLLLVNTASLWPELQLISANRGRCSPAASCIQTSSRTLNLLAPPQRQLGGRTQLGRCW